MRDLVDSKWMLEAEAHQIQGRRETLKPHSKAIGELENKHYFGLAFSGGGIRSGTFNLGILQGLARIGLLPYVDYLSTVSGGGYIGTWLHGVIKRHGLEGAEKILRRPDCEKHLAPDEDPLWFLRRYSSYLAPDLGLFSADFWVVLVIWFRNMILNQLMLIPFLALLILMALHIGYSRQAIFTNDESILFSFTLPAVFLLLLGVVAIAGFGVGSVVNPVECKGRENKKSGPLDRQRWAVICASLMMAASIIVGSSAGPTLRTPWSMDQWLTAFISLFVLFVVLQAAGGFLDCYSSRNTDHSWLRWLWLFVFPLAAAAATTVLLLAAINWIGSWNSLNEGSWYIVAYGPPLVGLVWLAGAGFHIGLMAADFPDAGREWLARVAAFLTIIIVGWTSLFSIGVFGAFWITKIPGLAGLASKWGLTGAWVATTISGVLSGMSERTNGKADQPGKSNVLEWIGKIAPIIFVIGLLVLISFGVFTGVYALVMRPTLTSFQEVYPYVLRFGWSGASWLTLGCGLLLTLLPFRININEFSMHYFYKNRLVRCYLGASHAKRRPSRLTGFDPCDDFPLSSLLSDPKLGPDECRPQDPYQGPYPILCCTLNLNTGSEMGKLERRGTSFVFTPLYSGYVPPKEKQTQNPDLGKEGFRQTCGYSKPKGLDIGTCMGISGAAANPNWGYHTSGPLAFLLTVFDVRLGWWIGNSRLPGPSKKLSPDYALRPLLSELFAQTDANSKFLNISDGGQFENLGLYELIRRRCRYIIVGDGEQDNNLTFESLGGAIRKCRIDFGVEINLNPRPITLQDGFSTTHCVVGRITYPEHPSGINPDNQGWILYLKASMTGDEPEDVVQYKSVHGDFPHQTTGNQFFTESQFESYRRLGLHIVESAFENVTGCRCIGPKLESFQGENWLERLFIGLERQWYPPTEVAAGLRSHHTEEYSRLMRQLSDDPDLRYLDSQIIRPAPTQNGASGIKAKVPEGDGMQQKRATRKAFFYCLELIQLIENVWADLRLYEESNSTNPKNDGWMTVFRYWVQQDILKETWQRAAYTYNPLFRQFLERLGIGEHSSKQEADHAANFDGQVSSLEE